jgi:ABC-type transport system involved in multi-copper enzyme maturation permease subunit
MRIGLGPVFACERSIASRRWQTYAARSFLLAALLVAMAMVAVPVASPTTRNFARHYAELGESYFYAMIGVELALVLLAAPAATAGAICVDRARGALAHVLVTDLSDAEIILGKLAARVVPILALVACTWPVMAISSLLGGIDPLALTLAFAIMIAFAVLGCSLAFMLSVWARKAHEVVLVVYFVWGVLLLAWPIWYALSLARLVWGPDHWLLVANPFYLAFAPYTAPRQIGFEDYLGFFGAAIAVSVAAVLLAVWRMRPVASRSDSKARKSNRFGLLGRLSRALPGPALDGNPVLWREWRRLRPSPWMVALTMSVWGTTTVACVAGAYWIRRHGVAPGAGPIAAVIIGVGASLILTLFGLLMLSVVAPTSMSEERQRGSLDVLVATPLSTPAILLAKWWGTFRLVPFLAIGPGLLALALATARVNARTARGIMPFVKNLNLGVRLTAAFFLVATILIYGAALGSLGVALATWIKRQSRAMATSVCIFVLIAVAWPVLMIGPGRNAAGLAELSPIYSAAALGEDLTMRTDHIATTLWWVGVWDATIAAAAIGLCWLAARTFDEAFGRIPERPRTSHWMADVVLAVAGMTTAFCLVRAVAIWAQGVQPHRFGSPDNGTMHFIYIIIELIGLIVLSVLATLSTPHERRRNNNLVDDRARVAPGLLARGGATFAPQLSGSSDGAWPLEDAPGSAKAPSAAKIVMSRWWCVFRLALLLAVAPGLVVLALATARDFWPEVAVEDTTFGTPGTKAVVVTYTTPTGESSRRILIGNRSDANVQNAVKELQVHSPVLPLRDRVRDAALFLLTFLGHAAAATSAGLALAIWIKGRRPRIVVATCLPLFVAIGWPICVYLSTANYFSARWLLALSPIWVGDHLLEPLVIRQPHPTESLGWIAAWDAAVIVVAMGFLYLTIIAEKPRGIGRKGKMSTDLDLEAEIEPTPMIV